MAGTDQQLARIAGLQKKYSDLLLRKKHVVGVSVGPARQNGKITGEFALVVVVDKKLPLHEVAPEDRIPALLEHVPVVVQQVGALEAL